MTKKLIVGITGASGSIIGVKLIKTLVTLNVECHLILSKWGRQTLEHETEYTYSEISSIANYTYNSGEMSASISSGSFITDGMIIAPCSMRTLAAIANGNGDTLIHRSADVVIKEKRPLLIMPREMPLSSIHLENMLKLSKLGVIIMPPVPAFYNLPSTIEDIINHFVARILDQFDIANDLTNRWKEIDRQI